MIVKAMGLDEIFRDLYQEQRRRTRLKPRE